ncbi:hypothetical protein COCOR_01869 [Corallococcus coralloides DSM 2259]|uniref:Lipoprotein n=1 Tax=Corallococcus coralloides (strain ATCC 25202 / DSM 2259 / NBRC 100086 / M2) TaxID=1144275 RepID=H8MEY0_CORCM|nr:hypothetical protein [Corallococcus coralloides]AFE04344.1 hypothetical protein COCOR_01869 [Corallococcus coralloides DSM 2259]
MSFFRQLFAATLLAASVASAEAPNASYEASSSEAMLGPLCHESLCETDQDCRNACSSARTATCVQNTCEFTYTGGGGGGGGPFCHEQFCTENWDCSCNGVAGYCGSDWTCHF